MNALNDQIVLALEAFSNDKLVAIPTETVYGLAAPINCAHLIEKVFKLKERPFFDPLIVHISSIEQARECAQYWPKSAQKLADSFWPGPLSIIVKKSEKIDDSITSSLDTVGLRMPKNILTCELIDKIGPLAAPSANKFTKTSPTSVEHVRSSFTSDDVYVLEDGPCEVGIESTIVLAKDDEIIILRPGILTPYDFKLCLGNDFKISEGKSAFENAIAPGSLPVHYRPDYELGLIDYERFKLLKADGALDRSFEYIELSSNAYSTARSLYSEMRAPLANTYKGRYFVIPKDSGLSEQQCFMWQSILNRLEKACTIADNKN